MTVVPASSLSRCEMHMLGSNVVGAVNRARDARASVNRLKQSSSAGSVLSAPIRVGHDGGPAKPIRMAS